MGYGVLPDNPARQAQDETTQTDPETAEPEGTEKETEKEEQAQRSPAAYMGPGMARGETDFGEYIIGIEVKKDGQTIAPGSSIEGKGNLSFNIAYTLPGGVLNPDDPTIIYDLPPQFKEIIGSSGNLGDDRGTYVITPEGKILITFSDEYVEKNQGGQHINGYISFDCDASRLEHGEDGKVSLDFNDKVKIELTVTDPTEGTEDLKVAKSAQEKWDEKGTIEYTIKITSKHGTQGPVKLTDIMAEVDLDPDSIQVINGPDGVSMTPGSSGFDMTLPPLGENGAYEIKYQAKAEPIPGGVQTKNHVQVESTDKDGGKLEGSAEANPFIKPNCIGKSGTLDGDTMKWTVTVNADKLNIGGWTLSDELNGEKFEGEVVITGEDGKQVTATLPYEFPDGANGTYTVTYETAAEAEPGDWIHEKNKATITDKKGNSDSAESDYWGPQYLPVKVDKQGTGVSAGVRDGELITDWEVAIRAEKSDWKAPWYYQDRLEGNNQWYTQEQMDAIQAAVQEAAAGKNLTCTFTPTQENGRYVGFRVDFETTLKKGETIAFAYQGTADAGNGSGGMTLKNKGSIHDKLYSVGENQVDKLIEKYDLTDYSSGDSSHEVEDANAPLAWGIRVKPPKGYNGGMLVVTEHLPAGVELSSLDIEVKPFSGKQDIVFNGTTGTADCHGYTVEAIRNERDIIIRIPEGLAAEDTLEEILLGVHANISDDCEWTASENAANVATFPNRVEITSQDGKTSGEDSQTQHVTKKDHVKDGVILKNHGEVHDNYVPYTIVVNPDGEDLAEGTDTLHLTDTLEFPAWVEAHAAVKPNSVQIYERNPDGSKGAKLPLSDYSYQLETGEGTTKFAKIYLTIPDEKALIVEYEYKIVGDKNTWVPITNSAVLDGITSSDGQNKTDYAISITESQAGAVIAGVDIYKVDKNDNSLFLEGAKFKLHRWDGVKGEYVLCDEMGAAITDGRDGIMATDKNGRLPIELAYNTAYYLEEIEAPKGYLRDKDLYYFYMWSADEEKYPSCKPEGFTGKKHVVGDVIYYPNEKDQAAVEVEKQWFRPDGTECTGQKAGSISFELWRRAEQEDVGESGTVTIRTEGGIWNTPIVENYPLGTKVHYCISYKWYEWKHGSITVNGTEIPGPAVTGGAQTATYDFTVTVEADTQVLVTLYDANSDGWECHAAGTEYPVKVVGEEKLGTYHISSESGWKWSMADVKDQEFPQTGTDAQGDNLYYKYFVKEVRSTNATVAYENNGGITEGTITVKNTESDSPSYELPSTGGSGTLLHTFSGLALMGGALIYEIKRRMRKQRSENVSSFSM